MKYEKKKKKGDVKCVVMSICELVTETFRMTQKRGIRIPKGGLTFQNDHDLNTTVDTDMIQQGNE